MRIDLVSFVNHDIFGSTRFAALSRYWLPLLSSADSDHMCCFRHWGSLLPPKLNSTQKIFLWEILHSTPQTSEDDVGNIGTAFGWTYGRWTWSQETLLHLKTLNLKKRTDNWKYHFLEIMYVVASKFQGSEYRASWDPPICTRSGAFIYTKQWRVTDLWQIQIGQDQPFPFNPFSFVGDR